MIRLLEDNVAIKLEPLNQQHGAVFVVREKVKVEQRLARVLACGPGHHTEPTFSAPQGVFVPVGLQAGQMVLVTSAAGHDYRPGLDLYSPRQNDRAEFNELFGEPGEYRVIRAEEALATFEGGEFHARGRFVIVKRAQQQQSPGGIYIPDDITDPTWSGYVTSVGPGRVMRDGSRRALECAVGQRVVFGQHAGLKLSLPGAEGLILLRDEDVIAVVEEAPEASAA